MSSCAADYLDYALFPCWCLLILRHMFNRKADALNNKLAPTEIVFRCKGVNAFQ